MVHRDIVAPSTLVEPAHVDVNIYGRVQRLNRQISYEFEDLISAELSPRFPGARSLYQRHLPLRARPVQAYAGLEMSADGPNGYR